MDVFPSTKGSIVKFLQQMVSSSEDVGLSSNTAWLLGHLFTASTTSSVSKTSVPSNYGYLSECSMLGPLFDFLVQAGKTGPHLNFSEKMVPAVLESLVSGPQVALPPVNWASVLSPLMRAKFGEETSQFCVKLAVNQAQSSSSLASFLSSLLNPVEFMGLEDPCKREVLQKLPRLVYVLSSSKLRQFYERTLSEPWTNETNADLWTTIFEAHLSVLRLKEPPPSVIGWTVTALEHIYNACSEENTDHVCLRLLARCLALIPVEKLERIVRDSQVIGTKALVVRCEAVGAGKVPVKWLMPCVDWVVTANLSEEKCEKFFRCVVGSIIDSDHKRKSDERQQWLLELIGQFKSAVQNSSETWTHQILLNCFTLLSMFSTAWCTEPLLQGLGLSLATKTAGSLTAGQCCGSRDRLPWLLPLTLSTLLKRDSFVQITGKVLDWLLSLRNEPKVQMHVRPLLLIQDTLISLRETDTFRKAALWTDVIAHYRSQWAEENREQK